MLLMWIVRKQNIPFFFHSSNIKIFAKNIIRIYIYIFIARKACYIYTKVLWKKCRNLYIFNAKKTCFKVHLYASKNVL